MPSGRLDVDVAELSLRDTQVLRATPPGSLGGQVVAQDGGRRR
jgi:hypothetical protein